MLVALLLALQVAAPLETTTPAAPADGAPLRLFVLSFKAVDVEPKVVTLIERAVVEAADDAGFEAVSTDELAAMVDVEAAKQAAGCDAASCLAEIAGSLGAARIVTGTVTRISGRSVLALTLFDGSAARVLARETIEAERSVELRALSIDATRRLLGLASSPPSSSSSSSSRVPLLVGGGIGVGLGVVAIGIGVVPYALAGQARSDAEAATDVAALGAAHDAYVANSAAWNSWGVATVVAGGVVFAVGAGLLLAGATTD